MPARKPRRAPEIEADPAVDGVIEGLMRVVDVDGRTRPAKAFNSLLAAITTDLGGDDQISEVRRQLVHRFAALATWAEMNEAMALAGDFAGFDPDLHGRVAGHLKRIAEAVGMVRVPKEVESLEAYTARLNKSRQAPQGEAAR